MGAIMINACKQLKLGGVVIDAAIRDSLDLREIGFPVVRRRSEPQRPHGVRARPHQLADLVRRNRRGARRPHRRRRGRRAGRRAREGRLAPRRPQKKEDDETARIADIKQGKDLKPKWLDASLRAAGLLKEGETL